MQKKALAKPSEDPLIVGIHAVRETHAKKFNCDLNAIFKVLKLLKLFPNDYQYQKYCKRTLQMALWRIARLFFTSQKVHLSLGNRYSAKMLAGSIPISRHLATASDFIAGLKSCLFLISLTRLYHSI